MVDRSNPKEMYTHMYEAKELISFEMKEVKNVNCKIIKFIMKKVNIDQSEINMIKAGNSLLIKSA